MYIYTKITLCKLSRLGKERIQTTSPHLQEPTRYFPSNARLTFKFWYAIKKKFAKCTVVMIECIGGAMDVHEETVSAWIINTNLMRCGKAV